MKQILQLLQSIIQRLLPPGAVEQHSILHQPAIQYIQVNDFDKNK